MGKQRGKQDDLVEVYAEQASRAKLLTKAEEQKLARAMKKKGPGAALARTRLIEANLRLVIHVARRYQNRGIPMLDLIQEGNIGLLRAVEKFEPQRGHRFSTYAIWWIQQSVRKSLLTSARVVRVPDCTLALGSEAIRAAEAMRQESHREPGFLEVAECMGKKPGRIADALRGAAGLFPVSLDGGTSTADNSRPMSLGATLEAGEPAPPPLDEHEIAKLMKCLSSKERFIITRRFGLDRMPAETLDSVARKLGVSRERIRQLQKEAIRKVREEFPKVMDRSPIPEKVELKSRRLEILEQLGWYSIPGTRDYKEPWDTMFERLVSFRESEGNCDVPKPFYDDPLLAEWVENQRELFRKGHLDIEKVERLNSLGFDWKATLRRRAARSTGFDLGVPSITSLGL